MRYIYIALFWFLVEIASAKEPLFEFYEAMKKHPDFLSLKIRHERWELEHLNTGLLPEPKIQADLSLTSLREGKTLKPVVGIMQMIPSRAGRLFAKKAKSAEGQIIELEGDVLLRQYLTKALLAWLDMELIQRTENLTIQDLNLIDFAENTISAHFKHHDFTLASILRLKSQRAELDTRLKNLKLEKTIALAALKQIFLNEHPLMSFPDEPEAIPEGKLEDHPKVKLLDAKIRLSDRRTDLFKVAGNPDIEAGIEYDPQGMSGVMGQNSSELMLMVGMQLKFDRSRYHRNTEIQRKTSLSLKEDLNSYLLLSRQKEIEWKSRFQIAENQLTNFKKTIIPNLKQALESKRAGYRSNPERDTEELIQILRELLLARYQELIAYKNAWSSIIQLTDLYDQKPGFL
ncbi:MAG: TolC family protein [Candidatus Cloacimonetes bacterium]|nr:TolC family protein [Candidatus Cloacimonadota bacterium]